MLLPRFLTALIGVPLLLLSIWWGQFAYFVLVVGIVVFSLYEFFSLAEEAGWGVSKKMGLFSGLFLTLSIIFFGTDFFRLKLGILESSFTSSCMTLLFIFLVISSLFKTKKEQAFLDLSITWLGVFYIAWSLAHLFLIRDIRPSGRAYTFFLFLVIWTLDVGAYFGGKKWGKNKLSEDISPKKTWEGVVSGSLIAFLVSIFLHFILLKSSNIIHTLILAIIIIVLAQLSDLSESLFKRNMNVKDSGSLLPGHGGILDRFDSFLLTTPVYYYVLIFWVIK